MGVTSYLVYYNKYFGPSQHYKLVLLALLFLAYLFAGAYVFREINLEIEMRERRELIEYREEFLTQHKCLTREGTLSYYPTLKI